MKYTKEIENLQSLITTFSNLNNEQQSDSWMTVRTITDFCDSFDKEMSPYKFQRDLLSFFDSGSDIVVASARQSGLTFINLIYAIWCAAAKKQKVVIGIHKFSYHRDIMHRILSMIDTVISLPMGLVHNTATKLQFGSGGSIEIAPTTDTMVRGKRFDVLLIMDAAFISHVNTNSIISSLDGTLNSAQVIVSSTPPSLNINKGFFHETWFSKYHKFIPTVVPWSEYPDRDLAWKNEMIGHIGRYAFDSEFDCRITPMD